MKAALSAHSLKKILQLPVWLLNTHKSQLQSNRFLTWPHQDAYRLLCSLSCKVSVSLNWGACQLVELCLIPSPPTPFQSWNCIQNILVTFPNKHCHFAQQSVRLEEKGSRIWSSLYFYDSSHFLCVYNWVQHYDCLAIQNSYKHLYLQTWKDNMLYKLVHSS